MIPEGRPADEPKGQYRPGTYLPALDGLRALAITAVLLYHDGGLVPGGFLGVDVFFVLSGFLITSLLFEEWRRTGRIGLRQFYLRRALRLFPALAVLLIAATAFALAFPRAPQSPHLLEGVRYSLVYMTNWAQVNDPMRLGPLGHTWSLAVEEQFYVVWPLLFIILLHLAPRRRALVGTVAAMAVASSLWRLALWSHGSTPWRLYNGTDTRADSLLVGCVAALLMSDARFVSRARRSRLGIGLAVVGALLIARLMASVPLEWEGYACGVFLAVAVGAAAILIAVLAWPDSAVTRLLATKPFVWVGRLSYSLYLWHMPIYGFVKPERLGVSAGLADLTRGVCTVAAASGSFYLVERPFLRLKRRAATVPVLPEGTTQSTIAS